jgi:hypothetical protein
MFGHHRVGKTLSQLLRFAPFICFALGVLAYVFFFLKHNVAPSWPAYSDPLAAFFCAAVFSIAGFFFVFFNWLFALKPSWMIVVGTVLNAALLAIVFFIPVYWD